jgi:tetratricopeptide (TPR) repeat protein
MKKSAALRGALAVCLSVTNLVLICAPCLAGCPAELNGAVADYNAKKYPEAFAKLKKVSAANRNHPYTHYYLGLAYQAIGNWAGAKQEFKWNYDNSKDAEVRYRSWAAYTALEKAKPGLSSGSTVAQASGAGATAKKDSTSNWGSAATLDKKAQVLDASQFETVTVTPTACGRRR